MLDEARGRYHVTKLHDAIVSAELIARPKKLPSLFEIGPYKAVIAKGHSMNRVAH